MTQDELDRLEALANAATSGPWCVWDGPQYVGGGEDLCIGAGKKWLANMDHRFCASIRDATFGPRECDPDTMTCDICTIDAGKITEEERANAAFIAAARDAVPALVAEVRRLRGLVETAYLEGAFQNGPGASEWEWENADARRALDGAERPDQGRRGPEDRS